MEFILKPSTLLITASVGVGLIAYSFVSKKKKKKKEDEVIIYGAPFVYLLFRPN